MLVSGLGTSGIGLCLRAYLVIPWVRAEGVTFPVLEMWVLGAGSLVRNR